jgi:hypothetical protein
LKDLISSNKYDFILLNVKERLSHRNKLIQENFSLLELAWHTTLSGSVIYEKSALSIQDWDILNRSKNFPQVAFYLCAINSLANFKILDKCEISIAKMKRDSYWKSNVFEVFFIDLYNTFKYSGLSNQKAFDLIQIHAYKTYIYSFKFLLKASIIDNYFNKSVFLNYFKFFNFTFILKSIVVLKVRKMYFNK